MKYSKRSHNAQGLLEKDLKKIRDKEKAKCRKFKKRHRKDLDPEEVEEIVAMVNQPYCLLKDVSQRF